MGYGIRHARGLAAALLVCSLVLAGVAVAQGDQRVISGQVVEVTPGQITLSTNTGPASVLINTTTTYEKEGPGTIFQIQPGQLVGVTSRPDPEGPYAVHIRIFPAALSTVRQGQSPMGGSNLGNTMTNAVVQSMTDDLLTVTSADQSYQIRTSPDSQVVSPQPATAADVENGVRVAATGTMGADNVLMASMINVLGPPPEMLPPTPTPTP
jgi:Domain of unknown function (DUF5666)